MAKSSKPRKKKNAKAEARKQSYRKVTKSITFCSMTAYGAAGEEFYLGNAFAPKKEHPFLFYSILGQPQHWGLTWGVACRAPNGETYFRWNSNFANQRFFFQDPQIQDWLNTSLAEVLEQVNKEHILSSFFFACPEQRVLTEAEVQFMLDAFQVFKPEKILSGYEMRQLGDEVYAKMSLPVRDYVDKRTADLLAQHNLNTLSEVYFSEVGTLKSIKGIGEKREEKIIRSCIQAMNQDEETFNQCRQFAEQNERRSRAKQYIIDRLDGMLEMWKKIESGEYKSDF